MQSYAGIVKSHAQGWNQIVRRRLRATSELGGGGKFPLDWFGWLATRIQ